MQIDSKGSITTFGVLTFSIGFFHSGAIPLPLEATEKRSVGFCRLHERRLDYVSLQMRESSVAGNLGNLLDEPQRVCVAIFNESAQELSIELECVSG
jgi:hypothetical protein